MNTKGQREHLVNPLNEVKAYLNLKLAGISSRSPSLRLGRITSFIPARGGDHLLFDPTYRENSTPEGDLSGHRDPISHHHGHQRGQRDSERDPALGPSFGIAPLGK